MFPTYLKKYGKPQDKNPSRLHTFITNHKLQNYLNVKREE